MPVSFCVRMDIVCFLQQLTKRACRAGRPGQSRLGRAAVRGGRRLHLEDRIHFPSAAGLALYRLRVCAAGLVRFPRAKQRRLQPVRLNAAEAGNKRYEGPLRVGHPVPLLRSGLHDFQCRIESRGKRIIVILSNLDSRRPECRDITTDFEEFELRLVEGISYHKCP